MNLHKSQPLLEIELEIQPVNQVVATVKSEKERIRKKCARADNCVCVCHSPRFESCSQLGHLLRALVAEEVEAVLAVLAEILILVQTDVLGRQRH